MLDLIAEMTNEAGVRYGLFLENIRAQADRVLNSDPTNMAKVEECIALCREIARQYVSMEQATLNDESVEISNEALQQINLDVGTQTPALDDRFAQFIFSAVSYTVSIIAGQVERDLAAIAQHLRIGAQRVDLYVRSGRYTKTMAVAQVGQDNVQSPVFRFTDRMGRNYKSSKHIRDIYRHHLLTTYNEVYLDLAAEHGHDTLYVWHPDPSYRWFNSKLALVSGTGSPLYYDYREEVFHPSSNALLTLLES